MHWSLDKRGNSWVDFEDEGRVPEGRGDRSDPCRVSRDRGEGQMLGSRKPGRVRGTRHWCRVSRRGLQGKGAGQGTIVTCYVPSEGEQRCPGSHTPRLTSPSLTNSRRRLNNDAGHCPLYVLLAGSPRSNFVNKDKTIECVKAGAAAVWAAGVRRPS